MNKFTNTLKKIFTNKNTVTIIGVVIVVSILFFGYKYQINKAVEPQRVPVAIENIQPRTEITEDMIEYIDIAKNAVSDNVVTNSNLIIGKYSNINSVIPKGSMFYKDVLIEKKELPDIAFVKVKKGEIVYNFHVNIDSTYGNSVYPGNYIDIYMKAEDDNQKVMVRIVLVNLFLNQQRKVEHRLW
ncbi:MAG: SAF domain-containing protein [Bacilli bacterium]